MADFTKASRAPLPNAADGVKKRQYYDLLNAFYDMGGAGGDYGRVFGDDAFTDDQARFKAVADRVVPGAFDELSGMDPMDVMAGYGIPSPEARALAALAGESMNNEAAIDFANRRYDSQRPYGFDFPQDAESVGSGSGDGMFPEAVKSMLPVVQTAGSYALPMLFSMLMRGGK